MYSLICTPFEVFQNQLVLRQDTECCLDGAGCISVAVQEQCRRIYECQLARALCEGEGKCLHSAEPAVFLRLLKMLLQDLQGAAQLLDVASD